MAARYFVEDLHLGYAQRLEIGRMLVEETSDLQSITIFDSVANGRVLVLDDVVQLTTRDEFTYSEMLVHVPAFELLASHQPLRSVLIVGGGDGAIAEEVLKHTSVEQLDMAEVDGRVIELCRQYFPDVSGAAFRDPRLSIHVVDAYQFLQSASVRGQYDMVIADRPDPVGPAQVLFTQAFYRAVAAALTPHGIATFQTGTPFFQANEFSETLQHLAGVFANSGAYTTVTPSYAGGAMALAWASRDTRVGTASLAELTEVFAIANIDTSYYSPAMHRAALVLPPWLNDLLPKMATSETAATFLA
jgi:spermidine synthase